MHQLSKRVFNSSISSAVSICRAFFAEAMFYLKSLSIYRQQVADGRSESLTRLVSLSVSLREPVKETAKILVKNQRFLESVERTRNGFQDQPALTRLINSITLPQQAEFDRYLLDDSRSKIFASFHFGNFIYGNHKAMIRAQSNLRCKVLTEKIYSQNLLANLRRGFNGSAAGLDSQLLLDQTDPLTLSAFLRERKTGLLMFADLPKDFGETCSVTFLSRQARFSKGIATLALSNRIPIVPLICFRQDNTSCVEFGSVIDPEICTGETRESASQRITQQLTCFFEAYFCQYPSQWRFLSLLPSYFEAKT